MAELIVIRKNHYLNYFRKIKLFLDGKFLDDISNGETSRFPIEGGNHTLEARIQLFSSKIIPFNVSSDGEAILELGTTAVSGYRGIVFPVLRTLLIIFGIWLTVYFGNYLILWITIVLLISWYISEMRRKKGTSLIFYLTTGRDQFLYLKPIE
jgi:hypothetical protein